MDRPVLIIHGFGATRNSPWIETLRRKFIEAGYEKSDIHMMDYSDNGIPWTSVGSPRRYAENLKKKVRKILYGKKGRQEENLEEVNIVAHSMGGLVARWYIEELDGGKNVNKLITLGTPHRGTEMAKLTFWTAGAKSMIPKNEFIKELNSSPLAKGVKYVAVWSKVDELVVPSERAKLEGAKNVHPGLFTHIYLPMAQKVFDEAILSELDRDD